MKQFEIQIRLAEGADDSKCILSDVIDGLQTQISDMIENDETLPRNVWVDIQSPLADERHIAMARFRLFEDL